MAGKIQYMAPIENASGKIFGKKERFCSVTRNFGNRRKGCAATGIRNLVEHPVSAKELRIRQEFSTISQAVAARYKSTSETWVDDQTAWKMYNKTEASHGGGVKTFRQWLWYDVKQKTA